MRTNKTIIETAEDIQTDWIDGARVEYRVEKAEFSVSALELLAAAWMNQDFHEDGISLLGEATYRNAELHVGRRGDRIRSIDIEGDDLRIEVWNSDKIGDWSRSNVPAAAIEISGAIPGLFFKRRVAVNVDVTPELIRDAISIAAEGDPDLWPFVGGDAWMQVWGWIRDVSARSQEPEMHGLRVFATRRIMMEPAPVEHPQVPAPAEPVQFVEAPKPVPTHEALLAITAEEAIRSAGKSCRSSVYEVHARDLGATLLGLATHLEAMAAEIRLQGEASARDGGDWREAIAEAQQALYGDPEAA